MINFIEKLIIAYSNEKNTITLLPYEEDIINNVNIKLESQKQYIKMLKCDESIQSIYEADYERVRYFASQYLLIRLKKIRENAMCGGFTANSKISEAERTYCMNFIEMAKKYKFYKEYTSDRIEYVGFMVRCNNKNIIIDNDKIEIKNGEIFVAEIAEVEELIHSSDIILL